MASPAFNVGPRAIAEKGTDGGPNFSLSKREFIAIQTYVTDALALPINEDEFRKALGPGAPTDVGDFVQLINAYGEIHKHCKNWRDVTFPKTVNLASVVVQYGRNTAPVYYPAILKEAKKLVANPEDGEAKAALKAILDVLQKEARGYADQANAVVIEVKKFAEDTEADRLKLVGTTGDGGMLKYYEDKYGKSSKEVHDLTEEIKAQRLIAKAADDEYDYDVVVSTTTPTYVWLYPIGTIAAAVVAGVYGDKAVKALERSRAAHSKIAALTDRSAALGKLMVSLTFASFGITHIALLMSGALQAVEKIQGVWAGIAADIEKIVKLIDTNIREAAPIIMDLGIDLALKSWANVASAADSYRVNAYVKEPDHMQTMMAWRVGVYLTSDKLAVPQIM